MYIVALQGGMYIINMHIVSLQGGMYVITCADVVLQGGMYVIICADVVLQGGMYVIICAHVVLQGGMYVFQLFDYYPGSRIVVLVGLIECIAVAYLYGEFELLIRLLTLLSGLSKDIDCHK